MLMVTKIKAVCRTHAVELIQEIVQSHGIKMHETDRYFVATSTMYNVYQVYVSEYESYLIEW